MYTQKESEPRQIVSDKLCQTNCVRQTVSDKLCQWVPWKQEKHIILAKP